MFDNFSLFNDNIIIVVPLKKKTTTFKEGNKP